jgi:F-type H+-transporting ATPase subunit gamma
MSDTLQSLRRKIDGAGQVASVVSAMKAVAASSIAQYDNAVAALTDYHRTIDLGLSVCFRHDALIEDRKPEAGANEETGVIVFGSDQGLVGQFNNDLADFV